ncbi:MAG: DoxX family membrane protein [Candidatus Riflebacteria bacterium]|nr:DoxX family membrane protein [Candidatus Riflebacteria bacterium]
MTVLRSPVLARFLGVVLGVIFIYASVDKIAHPAEFARIVYRYQMVGPNQQMGPTAANVLAVTLPWIEIVTGLLLVCGVWRREASLMVVAMTLSFMVAVSSALYRGIDLENCGCFTVTGSGRSLGIKLLIGDLVIVAAALVVALARQDSPPAVAAEPDDRPA